MTPAQEREYLAHVDDTCPGCERCDEDLRWEAIWNGPTAAQVKAVTRAVRDICHAADIAEARRHYGIHPSFSDRAVWAWLAVRP